MFFGVGTPRSATIVSTSPWVKPEWEQAWAQHDPDQASALLDELGLTERDADGFRTRPDGEAFLQILEHNNEADVPVLELYKEHFEEVGLKTEVRFRGDLWDRHNAGTDNIHTGTISSAEFREYTDAAKATEYDSRFYAVKWGIWIRAMRDLESGAKTLDDFADGKVPGEEPPDLVKELDEAVLAWGSSDYGSTGVRRSVPEGVRPARRAAVPDRFGRHHAQSRRLQEPGRQLPDLLQAGGDLAGRPAHLGRQAVHPAVGTRARAARRRRVPRPTKAPC